MARKSILSYQEGELEEINISPLIDMVFILLIFFIVTTVFVEEPGVEIRKPFAAASKDLEKNSILIANGAGFNNLVTSVQTFGLFKSDNISTIIFLNALILQHNLLEIKKF